MHLVLPFPDVERIDESEIGGDQMLRVLAGARQHVEDGRSEVSARVMLLDPFFIALVNGKRHAQF